MEKEKVNSLMTSLLEGNGIYLEDVDHRQFWTFRSPSYKLWLKGSLREVNANFHHSIVVKEISTNRFLTINGWVLQEIFFQDSWSYLCTPSLKVVDPNGTAFWVHVPKSLEPYIIDISLSAATDEDRINRISEGLDIFLEVSKYANKEEFENNNE